ncbi:MAG: hypothetical protein M3O31_14955 [Acidobacteriota bacterium]|nr:hypothetical protein [Acidobacteriota bacterium]
MTNSEMDDGTNRDDLIERLAMMERMIAEGRRSTTRCGWIFVLWGLVDIAGMLWQWERPSYWIWPTVLVVGFALFFMVRALEKRDRPRCANMEGRTIGAIWSMMGVATTLYVGAGIGRHLAWQYSFVAGIFMLVGLAHAISAMVLRWKVQGLVAGLWWAGAIAMFFAHSSNQMFVVFPLEMFFGMVLFGLYGMALERRDRVSAHV